MNSKYQLTDVIDLCNKAKVDSEPLGVLANIDQSHIDYNEAYNSFSEVIKLKSKLAISGIKLDLEVKLNNSTKIPVILLNDIKLVGDSSSREDYADKIMDLDNKYSSSKYVFIGVGIIRYWDTFVNISSKFWSPVSGSPDKVLNTNNICYSAFKDENDYFKTLDPVSDITMSQCAFYIKLKYNNETVPQKLIEFIENKDKTLQEISDSYDILTETADYSDGWIESSMALVLKSLIEIKLTYEQLELFRTGDLVIEGNSKCTLGQIIKHLEDYSTIRTKLSSRVVEMSTKCSKTCNYYRQEQKSLITDASISREEYDREQEYYGSQIKETLTSTLQYYKKIWHIIKDNSMLSKIKISNLSSTFTDTKVTEAFANVLEEMENFKLQ